VSAQELITEHLDLWTEAVTKKSSSGRGSNGKIELTGIKKLRELILELAVRGKLVEQDGSDESVEQLLEKIEFEKRSQLKAKKIRKPKSLPDIQEVDYPFSIPKSWRYCRLNDIGIWGSGATPKRGNTNYYGGGIPWFKSGELSKDFIGSSEETITDLAVQETSVRMNQPGDVLIAMYGATIGKASILEVAGTTNQAVCACTPWQGVSNRFLLLLLKAYRSRFIAMGAGGAQPNISRDKIIATVIGLPPEQEQHRIVQKVDELMALCDRLEQQTNDQFDAHETLVDTMLGTLTQSENATELAENWARLAAHFDTLFTTGQSIDKLKQTILQLAVMGRLVEQDAGDEPARNILNRIQVQQQKLIDSGAMRKPKPLPPIETGDEPYKLPPNWAFIRLGNCVRLKSGNSFPKEKEKPSGPYPYCKVGDMNMAENAQSITTSSRFIEPTPNETTYLIPINSIIFPKRGGAIATNKKRLVFTPIFVDLNIMAMTPYEGVVLEYLQCWLETIDLAALNSGTSVPQINNKDIEPLIFPLPPLKCQRKIVQKVDELMALCDQFKARLNQASETRCQLAEAVVEQGLSA